MTPALAIAIALLALCVGLQAFFSGSELALVSANRARLQADADGGSQGAGLALDLLSHEDRLLGTCLIGTNLCLVSATTLLAWTVRRVGLPEALWVPLILVPIALTFGEALPKTVLSHYANTVAPVVAYPLRLAQTAFSPLLWVVRKWSLLLEQIPGEAPIVNRENIVGLLDSDQDGGDIDPDDRALIQRLFAMNETDTEGCMTPLVDVVAVATDASVAEARDLMIQHGMSRIPVFEERIDNVIGIVSHTDLLFRSAAPESHVRSIMHSVSFVPESMPARQLLRRLRQDGEHLCIVVDEYGGAVGLVTMEDVLEEVFGEIRDERDKAVPGMRRLGERDWRIPARTEVEHVNDAIGQDLPEGDYETIAGLILNRLGRIPEAGEVVEVDVFVFHIEAANERAIQTVRLTAPRSDHSTGLG